MGKAITEGRPAEGNPRFPSANYPKEKMTG